MVKQQTPMRAECRRLSFGGFKAIMSCATATNSKNRTTALSVGVAVVIVGNTQTALKGYVRSYLPSGYMKL